MPPLDSSDESLLQASANGDERAFSELYERHARTIYNYLFRRLADWSEAEDLTAIVFLEAFRRRSEVVVVEGKLLPWLYGIATNVLRNRRRAMWRNRRLVAQLARRPSTDVSPDVAARSEAAEQMRAVHRLDEAHAPRSAVRIAMSGAGRPVQRSNEAAP
jgi:DNA-directed RNA polymerase specialized sigma24 family protein